MQQHLDLLGWKVKDKVTGFAGVVTHIGVDLFGCVQAIVRPESVTEKNGEQKLGPSEWFDLARLTKIGKAQVMKPIPMKGDLVVAGADFGKPIK